jgi:hypothetical protein
MRIRGRQARLERSIGTGCPDGRHRRGHAFVHISRQAPDGTVHSETDAPRPCGQVPEEVIEAVEVIIHSREEWERPPPEQRCQASEANR